MAGMARLPPIWNASVIYHELSTHLDLEQLYIHQHDSLINIHTHASNNNEPDNWQSPLVMLYIRTTCSWLVSTNSQRVSCVAIIFSCFFIIFSVRNSRCCDREDGEGRERERERERKRTGRGKRKKVNAVQPISEIRVGMRLSLAFRLQLRHPINNASLWHCTNRKKKSAEGRKERSSEQCSLLLRLRPHFTTLVSNFLKGKVGVLFFPFFISTCVCLYI